MFSFLNLMSTTKRFYTYIGNRTMYIYLLHGLVIGIVRGYEIYPFKSQTSVLTYGYLFIISIVIVYLLSTNFVCKWTNPLINLKKPSSFKG